MEVLNSEDIAGTHNRTGIVQLIDRFGNDSEMTSALGKDFLEEIPASFGKILLQVCE